MRASAALLLLLALAMPARAEDPGASGARDSRFAGDWSGTYVCTQGTTGMNLRLRPQGDGRLSGVFHFFPLASNPQAAEGCYEVAATPDGDAATITAGRWLLHPPNYVTVDLDAELDEDGTLFGHVIGPGCTLFAARRAPPRNLPAACGAVVSTR
ncbi:hypothetical protein [Falsiroseomonas stagni]|uniref:Uncharacterized protein n=1 Tax=Falsiroseomonas stagni DSM 19981 TaxID=1123062 RepID=A0A1I4ETH5_9PROT|nr:hypothetical protein [Falsiroseomonas stagni]SFL07806.1 hypothetical protein SAMN02745775_11811 [Falsiroseomonas stagni DSM 19981]